MSNIFIAEKIIEFSGGIDNFKTLENCMTRVRVTFIDDSLVDKDAIREITGVLGLIEENTLQIVVGPGKSSKIKTLISERINLEESSVADAKDSKKGSNILKMLSSIFVPLIPAIIASGFLQGINNILVNTAVIEAGKNKIAASGTLSAAQVVLQGKNLLEVSVFLGILSSATFGFLAIYTGITAAKVFKGNYILGGVIGAATIAPALTLINIVPGQGGIIGVILAVYIMSKIEYIVKKVVPDILDVVLSPTLTLILTAIVLFTAIMPFAGFISDILINGIMFLIDNSGIFGGYVLAAAFPSLIATGLHHGLAPIHLEMIKTMGGTPLFPIQIMSNSGLVGAGLAVLICTKSQKTKEIARGVLPPTFLAVGEPTMFGLLLPLGFPFITASIGAGFGGMMARVFELKTYAFGAAGMSALPLIADGKYLQYIIAYAVGCGAAFIITFSYIKIMRKEI
ncbi:MAG: PTS transporter subunit EIIC [Culicoidibacterales bacterium]